MTQSDTELLQFFDHHAECYRQRDVGGILSKYSDASLFWEACGSNLKGKDEIHGWFSIMFNHWQVESMEYDILAQRVRDDLACCACLWKIRCGEENSDEPLQDVTMRATYCLEKTDHGWKIWHVHGSAK